jgi:flagellar export protein FliJ
MKKFKFKLETVQKIRKVEMEQQAKVLALIHQEIALRHSELAENRRRQIEEVKRVKESSQKGQFDEQLMALSIQYRDELRRQEARKIKEIQELSRKASQEHAKLVEKEKRKKALDKLEEKHRENYEEENRKAECKEMDELASTRWFSSDDRDHLGGS